MTIYRAPRPDSGFTIIRNEVVRDSRLSLKARGLLLLILSRPDNWVTTAEQLAEENKEGRAAILSAFKELRAVGYMRQHRERDSQGRVRTITSVFDSPEVESPGVENRTPVPTRGDDALPLVAPESGFPTSDNPTPYRSTEEEEPRKPTSFDFEAWWFVYPRKVARGTAFKAYKAALKKAGSGQLLESAESYAERVKGSDPKFIAHPATWLNGERWLDDDPLAEPEPQAAGWWEAP